MSHPYRSLPDHAFWRRAVTAAPDAVDPVVRPVFTIAAADKVATAGSCFGQHIGRHLRQRGLTFLLAEPPHPLLQPQHWERFGYGVFSARYGNIYTARQLLQLFRRAFDSFAPEEDIWEGPDGFVDPFRPGVQPGGFVSRAELQADRAQHLAAVRRMFTELDVFVFTLGLTEAWVSRRDGAVFTVCPGVSGGQFDPQRHAFHNFTVAEVTSDMEEFVAALRMVNRTCRMMLTVSPVALAATALDRHVLVSTTYSKSVLRVAAEQVAQSFSGIAYFPSYEIITGAAARGQFLAPDLREVTEAGVAHVMSLFTRHYLAEASPSPSPAAPDPNRLHAAEMAEIVQVMCDEEALND